jgi:hypothetical protein
MARTYKRLINGQTICDFADRPIEWVVSVYGGRTLDWMEILPTPEPTPEELKIINDQKIAKKEAILSKLGLTQEELKTLLSI